MQVGEKGVHFSISMIEYEQYSTKWGKRSNTFPVKENIRQIVIAEGIFLNKIHLLVFYTL